MNHYPGVNRLPSISLNYMQGITGIHSIHGIDNLLLNLELVKKDYPGIIRDSCLFLFNLHELLRIGSVPCLKG